MKTQFDKIYVLSLITNKERQKFITYQFNQLGLDFEFVYGIDFYNFKNIEWPDVLKYTEWHGGGTSEDFGCTMTHYQAVMQAYYLGYNNVLIFEDDVCLNKDISVFEDMLNNIPENIDFIDYDPRLCFQEDQQQLIECINNSNERYLNLDDFPFRGAAMFAIMNRDTMKLYLDNQHKCFKMSDNVNGFFETYEGKRTINYYIPSKCLFVDQSSYSKVFIENDHAFYSGYDNVYLRINNYTGDNFFKPFYFHLFSK